MERGRQDCYFYYYSNCTKENCPFRHEPAALGCETICPYWQQGNCNNDHCNFRHMELKKNRKAIPCYWEMQPSGCTKPHCSFMHRNARSAVVSSTTVSSTENSSSAKTNPTATDLPAKSAKNQEWVIRKDESKFNNSGTESDQGRGSSDGGSFIGSPSVDTVIVNFEEGMRLY